MCVGPEHFRPQPASPRSMFSIPPPSACIFLLVSFISLFLPSIWTSRGHSSSSPIPPAIMFAFILVAQRVRHFYCSSIFIEFNYLTLPRFRRCKTHKQYHPKINTRAEIPTPVQLPATKTQSTADPKSNLLRGHGAVTASGIVFVLYPPVEEKTKKLERATLNVAEWCWTIAMSR